MEKGFKLQKIYSSFHQYIKNGCTNVPTAIFFFLIEYTIINLGTIKPIPFIYLWTIYIVILSFKILKTKVIEQDLQHRATNQKIINFVVLNEKEQIKQTISMVCMINILEKSKVQWLEFKFFSTIYILNFGWQLLFFSTI